VFKTEIDDKTKELKQATDELEKLREQGNSSSVKIKESIATSRAGKFLNLVGTVLVPQSVKAVDLRPFASAIIEESEQLNSVSPPPSRTSRDITSLVLDDVSAFYEFSIKAIDSQARVRYISVYILLLGSDSVGS